MILESVLELGTFGLKGYVPETTGSSHPDEPLIKQQKHKDATRNNGCDLMDTNNANYNNESSNNKYVKNASLSLVNQTPHKSNKDSKCNKGNNQNVQLCKTTNSHTVNNDVHKQTLSSTHTVRQQPDQTTLDSMIQQDESASTSSAVIMDYTNIPSTSSSHSSPQQQSDQQHSHDLEMEELVVEDEEEDEV